MQVAFYLAGEITQVKESIPGVRCASGYVYLKKDSKSDNYMVTKSFASFMSGSNNRNPACGLLPAPLIVTWLHTLLFIDQQVQNIKNIILNKCMIFYFNDILYHDLKQPMV